MYLDIKLIVAFHRAVEKILSLRMMEIKEHKEQDGYTGLHLAVFNANKEVVEFLLKQVQV